MTCFNASKWRTGTINRRSTKAEVILGLQDNSVGTRIKIPQSNAPNGQFGPGLIHHVDQRIPTTPFRGIRRQTSAFVAGHMFFVYLRNERFSWRFETSSCQHEPNASSACALSPLQIVFASRGRVDCMTFHWGERPNLGLLTHDAVARTGFQNLTSNTRQGCGP